MYDPTQRQAFMIAMITAACILVCAVLALGAKRLLVSVTALVGVSASLSLMLYLLGAPMLAGVELCVCSGLIAVLLVFTLNLVGEEQVERRPVLPVMVAVGLLLAVVAALVYLVQPLASSDLAGPTSPLAQTLWHDQAANTLLQIVLIFAGLISVLGLLPEIKERTEL
ncbi:MAG: NADH-quinone oxidoreductase subunit J [Anaerolineae bacterium]